MAKFRINVCLSPSAAGDVNAALSAAMAPFDSNLVDGAGESNVDGAWDRWRVDAGEGSRFAVKPEHDGDPRLIHGDGDPEPLRCDGGPRGLLDFAASRRQAVDGARARWLAEQRDFQRLLDDHPRAEPLTAFLARHHADPEGYPREQAIANHHAQPLVRALNNRTAWERYPSLGMWVLGPESDPITRFTSDPQPEFDRAATWAVTATALLTLEGHWIEPDRLGPFADLDDGAAAGAMGEAAGAMGEAAGAMGQAGGAGIGSAGVESASTAYARRSNAYLDDLAADCIVVRLLCHC